MKTFRDLISEVAQPKSKDEIDFKAKHEIEMIDHPESEEHQHTSEKRGRKRLADYEKGQDMSVYESEFKTKSLSVWQTNAKRRGLVVRSAVHPETGESGEYYTAKDKQGNHKGEFDVTKSSGTLREEADVEENAFMGKAAAAKKAGKDKFKLGDKKFPVTMKKDTAKEIAEAKMNPKQKAAIDQYIKSIEGKNIPKDLVKVSVDALMNALKESVELNESNADKMISSLISAISKYSDKKEFGRAADMFEQWAERFPNSYKKLVETPGIAGSFFSDLVEVLDIRVDLDESVEELDEISKDTLGRYATKALQRGDIAARMSKSDEDEMGKIAAKRFGGVNRALDKMAKKSGKKALATRTKKGVDATKSSALAYSRGIGKDDQGSSYEKTKRNIGKLREATDLTENFKQGTLTLDDGSRVTVSKQNADLLNQMLSELNPQNRRQMLKVAMEDEDGFNEILGFAREAL